MSLVVGLGYVGVNAKEAEKWIEFGTEVLGTPAVYGPDKQNIYLRVDDRSYRIAIHSNEDDGLAYVGWEIQTKSKLEELARLLESNNVQLRRGTKEDCDSRQVQGLIYCEDPDGRQLEFFYGPTKGLPFLPTRPMKGFLTGELGLGHVTLLSSNIHASVDFYANVLGFRISDYSYEKNGNLRSIFMGCNRRHHSIALANVPGDDDIHHMMLQVHDIDDLGTAYDLCRQKNIPILSTIGRHTNDRMMSFYVKSPSNFGVEYGCDGILVDDATWTSGNVTKADIWGHHSSEVFSLKKTD